MAVSSGGLQQPSLTVARHRSNYASQQPDPTTTAGILREPLIFAVV
ncbi:hypothetical protein [Actinotignum urinale]|nr:hypothetical protein [Actinotignum urinale]MDY5159937.1 hypothetical protein [Actinotignum urinale]